MLSFSKSLSLKSGASLGVLSLLMSGAAMAHGLPSNGHFVAGQGQIGKAGQSLTVKQSSTTGIINWSSFSVGKNNSVSFNNGSGATLNRVTGGNLSTIAGSLHATGSLYLMNSAGVIVSGTGHVVTGGSFVASSGSLIGSVFNDEKRGYGTAAAKVINRGSIIAGHEAKLVGSSVVNTGSMTAAYVKLHATDGEVLAGGHLTASSNSAYKAHVLVISDSGETKVEGTLSARNRDGSGGLIETSGQRVSIAGAHVDAGPHGTWLVDPTNLTVDAAAATTIDASLNAGTDVTLKTTKTGSSGPGTTSAGPGDIILKADLSWSTSASLTLDAYHSVHFLKAVDITGNGGLDILTNDGGKGGDLHFLGGSVDYGATDNGGTLNINGVDYTLIYSGADALNMNNDLNANYALATPLTINDGALFFGIGTDIEGSILNDGKGFAGIFEGLGNTVQQNLGEIFTDGDDFIGPFGYSSGTIRDVGFIGGEFGGCNEDCDGIEGGGLVAYNAGLVINSYSTSSVGEGGSVESWGGLVGTNTGTIEDSYSSGSVFSSNKGLAGGLVGDNYGTISTSYASDKFVDGTVVGGLVGFNAGLITQSFASYNPSSTGVEVQGTRAAGGLVAGNTGTIANSYATDTVDGNVDGGLAAENSGTIRNSYTASEVYESKKSGFVIGTEDSTGILENVYWDRTVMSSNPPASAVGIGSSTGTAGVSQKRLKTALLTGFAKSVWGLSPDINGGLPYLKALKHRYEGK